MQTVLSIFVWELASPPAVESMLAQEWMDLSARKTCWLMAIVADVAASMARCMSMPLLAWDSRTDKVKTLCPCSRLSA